MSYVGILGKSLEKLLDDWCQERDNEKYSKTRKIRGKAQIGAQQLAKALDLRLNPLVSIWDTRSLELWIVRTCLKIAAPLFTYLSKLKYLVRPPQKMGLFLKNILL